MMKNVTNLNTICFWAHHRFFIVCIITRWPQKCLLNRSAFCGLRVFGKENFPVVNVCVCAQLLQLNVRKIFIKKTLFVVAFVVDVTCTYVCVVGQRKKARIIGISQPTPCINQCSMLPVMYVLRERTTTTTSGSGRHRKTGRQEATESLA